MALIKNISLGTSVNLQGLNKGLSKASNKLNNWSGGLTSTIGGVALGNLLSSGIQSAFSGVKSLFGQSFSLALDTEKTETQFATLLKSTDKAKSVIGDLRDFGASTPFEFPELAEAGKNLLAFGFTTDELLPQMTQLGDVASGLGIPFGELSELYGKAKVSDTIYNEDLNQMMGRGIPIMDELAKVMGKPATAIKKLSSDGNIKFADLQKAFGNMTSESGMFAGGMKNLSATTGGLISTLRDNVNLKLGEIGTKLFETFNVKDLIARLISRVQNIGPTIDGILGYLDKFKSTFVAGFDLVISVGKMFYDALLNTINAVGSLLGSFIGGGLDTFLRSMVTGFALLEFTFGNWEKALSTAFLGVGYAIVKLVNLGIHWFTQLSNVVQTIGYNIGEFLATTFINGFNIVTKFAENIIAVFSNLPGLISGTTDWNSIFVPMTEGLQDFAFKSIEIEPRIEGDLEKNLRMSFEQSTAELLNDGSKFIDEKLSQAFPNETTPTIADIKPDLNLDAPGAAVGDSNLNKDPDKNETKFSKLNELGSDAAREILLANRGSFKKNDETLDVNKKQLKVQEATLEALKGNNVQEIVSIA